MFEIIREGSPNESRPDQLRAQESELAGLPFPSHGDIFRNPLMPIYDNNGNLDLQHVRENGLDDENLHAQSEETAEVSTPYRFPTVKEAQETIRRIRGEIRDNYMRNFPPEEALKKGRELFNYVTKNLLHGRDQESLSGLEPAINYLRGFAATTISSSNERGNDES